MLSADLLNSSMKSLFILFCFLIITFGKQLLAQIAPLSSPFYTVGPHVVVTETLNDASPNLLTYRPSNAVGGPFPVLLFQPGANGFGETYINVNSYDLYMEHLASFGYVVVVIDNTTGGPDNSLFTGVHDRLLTFSSNLSHWMNTYADMNKLIVGGHSNGGLNATQMALQRPSQINGIVYMASYPNPGIIGIGADDVSTFNGDVLFLNGNEDATSVILSGTTNDIAYSSYTFGYSSSDCKTRVFFNGVGHAGFGDYTHPSQTVGTLGREPITASIRHYLVSFMERTLKADPSADEQFLQSQNRLTSVLEFESTCLEFSEIPENEILNDVFPNPCSDLINFSSVNDNNSQFKIFNSIGQIVNTGVVVNNQINLNYLNSGVYLLFVGEKRIKIAID